MRQWLFFCLFVPISLFAQLDSNEVVVKGLIFSDETDRSFYDLMVVNKRTHSGVFGEPDGSFEVKARLSDTLMFGAVGLETAYFAVDDTTQGDTIRMSLRMKPLSVALRAVEILPERTLKQITEELENIGFDERDYRTSGVNAIQSPITFLYESFSKRERSKRRLAELLYEDKKRELLKELLHKYVEYDIINLSDQSFDEFIDFVNIPDNTLRAFSQYEFLLFIKRKYQMFTSLGPTRRY